MYQNMCIYDETIGTQNKEYLIGNDYENHWQSRQDVWRLAKNGTIRIINASINRNGQITVLNKNRSRVQIYAMNSLQRDLKLEEGPLIENKAVYLYNKIKSRDTIQDIMYGQIYDIRTNVVLDKESSTTVRILTNNGFGCIEQNKLADNEVANKCRDSYNVFISHAMSEHAGQPDKNGQYKVIGKHGILNPGEVCTDTYLVLGAFESKKEAENCLKYVETKFFRFLLMLKVSSVIMQPKQFNHIPMQDFSDKSNINWSDTIENIDEQLFKKYKLSEKEKKHIKSIIKPA